MLAEKLPFDKPAVSASQRQGRLTALQRACQILHWPLCRSMMPGPLAAARVKFDLFCCSIRRLVMTVKLYHNPRCSKSRATLALLEQAGADFEVIEYLQTPLDKQALKKLIAKLGLGVRDILRSSEAEFKEAGVSLDSSEDDLLELIVRVPKLMQRPIVETDAAARIGRPPEQVLELLS